MEDAKTVFQNKVLEEDQCADSRLARGGSGEISDAADVKVKVISSVVAEGGFRRGLRLVYYQKGFLDPRELMV